MDVWALELRMRRFGFIRGIILRIESEERSMTAEEWEVVGHYMDQIALDGTDAAWDGDEDGYARLILPDVDEYLVEEQYAFVGGRDGP